MDHKVVNLLDLELSSHDVQALNSADAVVAFFAQLGYKTDARIPQTPGNLGITAEGTVRPIRKIELIADQEGLFQVYLFELVSVTVAHTRALARAFRNLSGNYLFVLTSDYEHLDFVLLEKYLPTESNGTAIGQKQVGIRPHVLTVERRKPSRVDLRVLRRLTWTESDPFAQYDKLLSAYALADWSEEFFNNRALFSDYYLLNRLPDLPVWTEDPKPSYVRLRELYHGAASRFAGKDKNVVRNELIEPVLQALGFEAKPGRKAGNSSAEPDYHLYSTDSTTSSLALCLVYPWERALDGKDVTRDRETPDENPGAVVVSLLEKGEAPWVLVTNGRLWRLHAQRTHARATNYYEIDLEEVLAQAGPHAADPAESVRYFWLLFRHQAFEPITVGAGLALPKEGVAGIPPTFLDRILAESEDYAKGLGERLKDRVFEQVFPHLATGFMTHIRERDGLDTDLSQEALHAVFQGTLTLLYRMLFLLYAEARDLLPVKEVRGYFEASLKKLKGEVAEAAGTITDEVEERLKKTCREDQYDLYDRAARLFRIVDKGDCTLNVPMYNGGLFLSDPAEGDESPEAQAARFLNTTKVPDRFLARAMDLLARDVDPKQHDLVFIDFKSLGVRQLGSIYEGLLEFKLRIVDRELAIVKDKGREVYVSFNDLDEKDRERADRQGRVIKKGHVYLENDKRERKATGSYYTPDHIVQYIVEHAVGPVLQEKFEAMRPKLRQAQQERRAFFQKQEALRKQGLRPEPESKAELIGQELVDELFDIKVLDPAMGSGHFLVEAVDHITDKALDFLNAFPWNPVFAYLARMRETILREMDDQGITIDARRLTDVNLLKRHILKRCIYGVDLNPMAVELAKVSLWLDCFTLGAPLSFLDHHLRCGNSLIGVTVDEVNQAIQTGQLSLLSGSKFEGMKQAVAGMIRIGELSDVTASQVTESRREYRRASDAMLPAKRLLDIYTSQWFGNTPTTSGHGKKKAEHNRAVEFLRDGASERWAQSPNTTVLPKEWKDVASVARLAVRQKRFFHWELEFPEVFYGTRPGTRQAIERLEGAGFDAVIGNPPYVRVQELRRSDPAMADFLGLRYRSAVKNFDIYLPFFELGLSISKGQVSYIAPNKWFATDYGVGLRKLVVEQRALASVVDFRDFQLFEDATNYTCILALSGKPKETFIYVDASSGIIGQEDTRPLESLPYDGGVWTFTTGPETLLLQRLLGGDYPRLKELRDRAFQGLRTSDNDVYILRANGPARKGLLPVTSRATGQTHEIETALLKPLLSGDEIRAFSLSHGGQWILFPYDLSRSKPELFSEKCLREEYDGAWKYLRQCEDRLRAREHGKMDGPGWWGYVYPKNLDQFEQPKVMLPDYHEFPAAALDLDGRFYSITAYCLTLRDDAPITLPVLACLLNSDLLFWVLAKTGTALQRGFVRFMPQYLDKLPIVLPDPQQGRTLEALAQRGMREGYDSVKAALNKVVYRLYGLTDQEIALVGGRGELLK